MCLFKTLLEGIHYLFKQKIYKIFQYQKQETQIKTPDISIHPPILHFEVVKSLFLKVEFLNDGDDWVDQGEEEEVDTQEVEHQTPRWIGIIDLRNWGGLATGILWLAELEESAGHQKKQEDFVT